MKGSESLYYFHCETCNHDFKTSPASVTRGAWCSYCANLLLCEDECKVCYEKSFASHPKSKHWSPKNKNKDGNPLLPRHVFKNSNTKYTFLCNNCNHEFDVSPNKINAGRWCPYCCVPCKKLCNDNCNQCFNKSFASHPKSQFFSDNNVDSNGNKIVPRQVLKGSDVKYKFICGDCNGEFECPISGVTGKGNRWCSLCVNKTETFFYDFIKELYPSVIRQFKVNWCKNINFLPFDFCIPELKIIIEVDGIQHFKQVSNWASPEEAFKKDIYKQKSANENNYSMIRILQMDIYYNKYDWKKEIVEKIEYLKTVDAVQNIYMCKKNEYEKFLT